MKQNLKIIIEKTISEFTNDFVVEGGNHLTVTLSKSPIQTVKLDLKGLNLSVLQGDIYIKPEENEKYWLAMRGLTIPFVQPKKERNAVLKEVKKFARGWIRLLNKYENKLV